MTAKASQPSLQKIQYTIAVGNLGHLFVGKLRACASISNALPVSFGIFRCRPLGGWGR